MNSRRLPHFCGFDRHAIRPDRLRSDKIADQKDRSRPVDVSPSNALSACSQYLQFHKTVQCIPFQFNIARSTDKPAGSYR
jgi:hypothetical protein